MFCEKLENYDISIGSSWSWSPLHKSTSRRTLKLELSPYGVLTEHDFEALLKRSDELELKGLKRVKSVAYELDGGGFPQLKHLKLQDSSEIRWMVDYERNIDRPPAFPSLRRLYLLQLRNLENISVHDEKQLMTTECKSFGKLRKINVSNCFNLKSLF